MRKILVIKFLKKRKCTICGKPARSSSKYCSEYCRKEAYRKTRLKKPKRCKECGVMIRQFNKSGFCHYHSGLVGKRKKK